MMQRPARISKVMANAESHNGATGVATAPAISNPEFARGVRKLREADTTHQRLMSILEGLRLAPARIERMPIKSKGRVVFVNTATVDWVEAADNYVCLHCGSEAFSV